MKVICEGLIDEDQVAFVVPAFVVDEDNTKEEVADRYRRNYWPKYPDQACEVWSRLEVRSITRTSMLHCRSHGIWIKEEDFVDMDCRFCNNLKIHTENLE